MDTPPSLVPAQAPPPATPPAPRLTDRPALVRQRARAARPTGDRTPEDWLHRIALDEVQDRLLDINRTFTDVAVVTGMPAPWRAAFPRAGATGS